MKTEFGAPKITEATFSEQPLNEKEKKLVEEVYQRLAEFQEGCDKVHNAAKICRRVVLLDDPYQDPEKTSTSKRTLQLHTLKSTYDNSVADQMLNMPEAHFIPETLALQGYADDLTDFIEHVYDLNNYSAIHKRRVEDFFCVGTAITQYAWDQDMSYGRGDIAIIRWPIENFLWDPLAENIQDARALIKVSWHPLEWYTDHYPDKAQYVGTENSQHQDVGMGEATKELYSRNDPRAMLLEYWYRRYNAKTRRYTINVAYCAGGALLEHHEDVYMHGLYPFVVDVHTPIEGVPVGSGLVSELTNLMRYINRYATYLDTNFRMGSTPRALTRKAANIDQKAFADYSKAIVTGDAIGPEDLQWIKAPPLPPLIGNILTLFQSSMKEDSGQNQFSRGETTSGVTSGKAISVLREAGGKITSMRTDTLNAGSKQGAEQILWLMAQFYDEDRKTLISGKAGRKSRSVTVGRNTTFGTMFNGGAFVPPPYMVQIEITQRDPEFIAAQNNLFMSAYSMSAQAKQYFPLTTLFNLLNITGKDRIIPALEEADQLTEMINTLQQQNQQLSEQMQEIAKQNEALKLANLEATGALANVTAQTGGKPQPASTGKAAPAQSDNQNQPQSMFPFSGG